MKSRGLSPLSKTHVYMNWLVCLGALLSIAMVLTSCTHTKTLSASDNGKSIQVQVGDQIQLQLDANPTTGFDWSIEQTNSASLALQSTSYQSPNQPSTAGGGGIDTFTFQALKAGTVHLQLKYWPKYRPSYNGGASVNHFALTLQISGG